MLLSYQIRRTLRSPPTKKGVRKMAEKKAKEEKKEARELTPFPSRRSLLSAVDEMERLFDRYVGGWGLGPPRLPRLRWPEELEVSFPDVDVFEEGNEVVVKAEMPGVKKEEVDIELTEDSVTISGEKKKEEKVEKKDYCRVERSYGSFSRTVALPAEVKAGEAKAVFKNGVLEMRIPKKEETKKVKVSVT
jgi:HSP20 family protein